MESIKVILATAAFLFSSFAYAITEIPEFEFTVVETLPAGVNLNMSLSEIEDVKHASKIQRNKRKIYSLMTEQIGPLLNQSSIEQGYNLIKLAQSIQLESILNDVIESQSEDQTVDSRDLNSKFIAFILPKLPGSERQDRSLPYAHLYSPEKAHVIDSPFSGFQVNKSYSELINEKIEAAIHYSYQRNYVELGTNQPFFIGAMIEVNLAGPNTTIKLQMLGGLPTETVFPFVQEEAEAKITGFRLPYQPQRRWFVEAYENYPGVVLTTEYSKASDQPLTLKLKFGSLGEIETSDEWDVTSSPLDGEPLLRLEGMGLSVRSLFARYNTPHLEAEVIAPVGNAVADFILAYDFDLKINIHELEIDLLDLKITNVKSIVQFVQKNMSDYSWWTLKLPIIGWMPLIEQDALNGQIRDAGNDKIEPYRERAMEIKSAIETGGLLRTMLEPENQEEVMNILNQMLTNEGGLQ